VHLSDVTEYADGCLVVPFNGFGLDRPQKDEVLKGRTRFMRQYVIQTSDPLSIASTAVRILWIGQLSQRIATLRPYRPFLQDIRRASMNRCIFDQINDSRACKLPRSAISFRPAVRVCVLAAVTTHGTSTFIYSTLSHGHWRRNAIELAAG
jgi:hypothetical protein